MEPELLKCDHCDYTTPRKADLKKHLKSVHFPTFPLQTQKKRTSSSLPRKQTAEDVIANFRKKHIISSDEEPHEGEEI